VVRPKGLALAVTRAGVLWLLDAMPDPRAAA
jgi:hypothetical protein